MTIRKHIRVLGAATMLASIPVLSAVAQTSPQTPPSTTPPASTQPVPVEKQPMAPSSEKSAASTDTRANLVGLSVTSSEGTKLGAVQDVETKGGKVTSIHIKTGGMLGMGAKLVAIPLADFSRTGDTITLRITADEVSKLPELKIPG